MTAGWGVRAMRAAVFAAVCVVLAALGHVMMSGDHVPVPVLLGGWAVTGAAGWCLAGRERGLGVVVAVAVVVQTALHSAFSLAPGATAPAPTAHGAGSTGSMDSMPTTMPMSMPMPLHTGMGHAGHMGDTSGGDSSLGMLAAHLLAALLCGLWLGHGERAVFRLLRALGSRLAAPLRLLFARPAPPPPPARVRRPSSDPAPRLLLLVHAITSRGPPVGTAAA
ncbi:hypothetical protein [Streptomyces sp. XY006]|uniref:hypothetical protein n=1 Tax=Streptomyces sp. XY006 TaxID=2021410 RepID=UPI000B8BD1CF|nr:hypothetical protein [Streptomyces sp. XY006]OXS30605.1 hypothetical protein CHR28_35490 [Streptomyces sp. XY006]